MVREPGPGSHGQRVQEHETANLAASDRACFAIQKCPTQPRAIHNDVAARPLSEAPRLSRSVTVVA